MFLSGILAPLSGAFCQQVQTTVTEQEILLLYQYICFNILLMLMFTFI